MSGTTRVPQAPHVRPLGFISRSRVVAAGHAFLHVDRSAPRGVDRQGPVREPPNRLRRRHRSSRSPRQTASWSAAFTRSGRPDLKTSVKAGLLTPRWSERTAFTSRSSPRRLTTSPRRTRAATTRAIAPITLHRMPFQIGTPLCSLDVDAAPQPSREREPKGRARPDTVVAPCPALGPPRPPRSQKGGVPTAADRVLYDRPSRSRSTRSKRQNTVFPPSSSSDHQRPSVSR